MCIKFCFGSCRSQKDQSYLLVTLWNLVYISIAQRPEMLGDCSLVCWTVCVYTWVRTHKNCCVKYKSQVSENRHHFQNEFMISHLFFDVEMSIPWYSLIVMLVSSRLTQHQQQSPLLPNLLVSGCPNCLVSATEMHKLSVVSSMKTLVMINTLHDIIWASGLSVVVKIKDIAATFSYVCVLPYCFIYMF